VSDELEETFLWPLLSTGGSSTFFGYYFEGVILLALANYLTLLLPLRRFELMQNIDPNDVLQKLNFHMMTEKILEPTFFLFFLFMFFPHESWLRAFTVYNKDLRLSS